jgi:hypothetical protein
MGWIACWPGCMPLCCPLVTVVAAAESRESLLCCKQDVLELHLHWSPPLNNISNKFNLKLNTQQHYYTFKTSMISHILLP